MSYELEERENVVRAIVWVVCPECGDKHRLLPGVGTPIYWCGNTLCSLKAGDDVEYEEVKVDG